MASEDRWVSYKDFDASKVVFKDIRKNKLGGKQIDIVYKNSDGVEDPLIIRFPKMFVTTFFENKENPHKISLSVSLKDTETRTSVKAAREVLHSIDEMVLSEAVNQGMAWFRQQVTRDSLKMIHKRSIRQPSDPKYDESFWPVVYTKDDHTVNCKVLNEEGTEAIENFPIADVRMREVMILARCTSVWISGGQFGVSWKVMMIRPYAREKRDVKFIDVGSAISFADIIPRSLTFAANKDPSRNTKWVNFNGKALVFKTPPLYCKWGLQSYPDADPPKPYIELHLRDLENDSQARQFRDVLMQFDNVVKQEAAKGDWFRGEGGTVSTYADILRQKNTSFPATFKISVPYENGDYKCEIVYMGSDAPFGSFELQKRLEGAIISATVQCTGVWTMKTAAGVSFKALKLEVRPSAEVIASSCKMTDDDEDVRIVESDDEVAPYTAEKPEESTF